MIVDELIAILGYRTEGEGDLKRFQHNIDSAAKSMSAFGVAAGTFIGTIAANAFMRLGDAVTSLPGNIIATSAQFEGFQTSLETIEGSAEKARSSMDWITEFAAKTPYELAGVTASFVKLKSYGIDPMNGVLTTLGDTASAMNKPLDMAVEAFADATNFQFERLREFGLVASQKGEQVTFQWTKNGKQMTKVVKKNGGEIQKFMLDHFGSTFSGAMLRQSKTWSGMVSNLGDSWNLFQKRIGDRGFFDAVKQRLATMLDGIGQMDDDGTLARVEQAISDFLTGSMRAAEHVGRQLWSIGKGAYHAADGITNLISKVTGLDKVASAGVLGAGLLATSTMGRGLMVAMAKRMPMIAALLAFDDILTGLNGGDSYVGKLKGGQEALDGLKGSLTTVSDAFGSLSASIGEAMSIDVSNWSIKQFLNDAMVGTIRAISTNLNGIAEGFRTVADAVKTGDWAGLGTYLADLLVNTLKSRLATLEEVWTVIQSGAQKAFALIGPALGQAITDLVPNLAAAVKSGDWEGMGREWAALMVSGIKIGLQAVGEIWTMLSSSAKEIDWKSVGITIAQAIFEGIKSLAGFIKGFWSEIGKSAYEAIFGAVTNGTPPEPPPEQAPGQPPEQPGASNGRPSVFNRKPGIQFALPWEQGQADPANAGKTPEQIFQERMQNAKGHLAKMTNGASAAAVVNDNKQDNRQTTVNTTVNQTVQQAAQAPSAAAQATASAVAGAAQSNLPPTRTVGSTGAF